MILESVLLPESVRGNMTAKKLFMYTKIISSVSFLCLGSSDYQAPEVTKGKDPTMANDIWSFGVLLFQLYTGKKLESIYESNLPRFKFRCKHSLVELA